MPPTADRHDEPEVPSADAIVAACLAALPADVPSAGPGLDRAAMRRSRTAKNLVEAASWHRERVRDPALAARLDEWIANLPRLV